MEGRLKSMDKRYDAKVDKAIMALRLQRYASRVPAGQRVPELDAWLGIGASDKAIPGLDAKLDALYAGSKLGDEATRLQLWKADKVAIDASGDAALQFRSDEHTSELQSLMRLSYAVFCLKKKKK